MKYLIIVFIVISSTTAILFSEPTGKIINGLRVIADEDLASGNLIFYRGDYVVFPANSGDQKTLTVKDLSIHFTFPAKDSKKNYVKFKKAGTFNYEYNGHPGIIKVVEYTEPNYQAINSIEAKKIIENISPLILDVRTPYEYKMGHIEGAILIPVQNIQSEFSKILDYKNKPVLIYCATGNRSTVSSRILINNGFKNIYNMRYGIKEWMSLGYPVKSE